jgi:hypothetical protein
MRGDPNVVHQKWRPHLRLLKQFHNFAFVWSAELSLRSLSIPTTLPRFAVIVTGLHHVASHRTTAQSLSSQQRDLWHKHAATCSQSHHSPCANTLPGNRWFDIVVLPVQRNDQLPTGLDLDSVSLPASHRAAVGVGAFVCDVARA